MKLGFTLSEILITLGVVGVVSAMTLPTLINNYQKMQTVNQLKSTYTLVYNALKRAEVDYGDIKTWEMEEDPEVFADKYLKPYLKIVDEFDNDKIIIKRMNGKLLNEGKNFKHYTLANGGSLSLAYNTSSTPRMNIFIDINGLKEPNRIGFDIFGYAYKSSIGFGPICNFRTDREYYKTAGSNDACKAGKGGNCCSTMIMHDGWKIENDYPWKNK